MAGARQGMRPPGGEHPVSFEEFFAAAEPRLRRALVARYGTEVGRDAAADALAYAWEHWDRVGRTTNPAGYVYRVGQSRAGRSARPTPVLFLVAETPSELYEPGLEAALASLTERQRTAVVLVHGFEWTLREVADLTGTTPTTIQTHLERGLRRLRSRLEVQQ